MIRIEDRVWSAWGDAIAEGDEPSILMRLSSVRDPVEAARAVADSISEMLDSRREALRTTEERDPPWPGEWEWFGVLGGVFLLVAECDLFEEMIAEFAHALERRGVGGVLDLHEWPSTPSAPPLGRVLSCHLRVRGRRVGREPGDRPSFSWEPDLQAYAALLEAAVTWCKSLGDRATYEIRKATIGPFLIGFSEDAVVPLLEAVRDRRDGWLGGATTDTWREVGVAGYVGRLGLDVGGASIDAGEWRPALDELRSVLRANADLLVYAHVRHRRQAGVFDFTLDRDWPTRADDRPRAGGNTTEAFEDVFAPDAFAIQLFGEGYSDRVPDAPSYRKERAGRSGTLLEHSNLEAWFGAPFTGDSAPAVLTEARAELDPILYTPGALNRAGYTDVPGL